MFDNDSLMMLLYLKVYWFEMFLLSGIISLGLLSITAFLPLNFDHIQTHFPLAFCA